MALVSTGKFIPDGDGVDDLFVIRYKFDNRILLYYQDIRQGEDLFQPA